MMDGPSVCLCTDTTSIIMKRVSASACEGAPGGGPRCTHRLSKVPNPSKAVGRNLVGVRAFTEKILKQIACQGPGHLIGG